MPYDNKDRERQIEVLNAQLAQQERSTDTVPLWLLITAALVFVFALVGVPLLPHL
jgi:Na+/H+ antiporter NhaC